MEPEEDPVNREIDHAIDCGDVITLHRILSKYPEKLGARTVGRTWLHYAAEKDNTEILRVLLDLGSDINADSAFGPPLMSAIRTDGLVAVRYLLEHGAEPNRDRALIAATNCESQAVGLGIVKLLVEHGADINRVYPWFGDEHVVFSPLSWAEANGKTEIAEYLRSKGATRPPPPPPRPNKRLDEEVVEFFQRRWNSVDPQALQEIVPGGLPIAIHVARGSAEFPRMALFTTGMSAEPMNVPVGEEKLRYAELTIQLPLDWPLDMDSLRNPDYRWPFDWLRNIARYPHAHHTWLGGVAVIVANGEPPQRLSPNTPFTSLLLVVAEEAITCQDGRKIQIYQVFPLYTEERDLEMSQGIPALLQALDRNNITWVVDPNRPNVGISN